MPRWKLYYVAAHEANTSAHAGIHSSSMHVDMEVVVWWIEAGIWTWIHPYYSCNYASVRMRKRGIR